ncbi:MAG: phosphate transport system substrate-binding protein [Verrucomicrobiota bacterium]|jgi:phosphate transport system substrate-binding protein
MLLFRKILTARTSKACTVIAVLSAALIGSGCFNQNAKQNGERIAPEKFQGKIRLTGSSTMAPLIEALGKRFQRLHRKVVIEVETGGSARGIHDVREGSCNIGMVGRPLKEEERDLIGFPIARDGVCLIVHKDNPVKSLSSQQVARIYTGQITNWKEVGGNDADITAINRPEGRAQSELFTQYFKIKSGDFKVAGVAGDNEEGVKAVVENHNAIVYMSVGEVDIKVGQGAPIKSLLMDGIPATSRNVRNGHFPIQRPLMLVARTLPSGLMKAFVDFALSPNATEIIRECSFVPYLD